MGMPNMMNNNIPIPMGMGFGMADLMELNEEWMKGFKAGVQEPSTPKKNIIFNTTHGRITQLIVDLDLTIDELLKKYLKHFGREELIGDKHRICFLFNARKIKFGDKTTVKEFFHAVQNPKITVNDISGLIG